MHVGIAGEWWSHPVLSRVPPCCWWDHPRKHRGDRQASRTGERNTDSAVRRQAASPAASLPGRADPQATVVHRDGNRGSGCCVSQIAEIARHVGDLDGGCPGGRRCRHRATRQVADGAPAKVSAATASSADSEVRVRIVAPDRPTRRQRERSPTAGRFRRPDGTDAPPRLACQCLQRFSVRRDAERVVS